MSVKTIKKLNGFYLEEQEVSDDITIYHICNKNNKLVGRDTYNKNNKKDSLRRFNEISGVERLNKIIKAKFDGISNIKLKLNIDNKLHSINIFLKSDEDKNEFTMFGLEVDAIFLDRKFQKIINK